MFTRMFARTLATLVLGSATLMGCDSGSGARTTGTPSQATVVAPPAAAPSAPAPSAPAPSALTRVEDVTKVCMVTDQFMGTAQIPVEVGGKTYYGCCEMCKARLANEAQTRTAKDPVTGEEVDKSVAVIGRDAAGKLHYFASPANLARYQPTL